MENSEGMLTMDALVNVLSTLEEGEYRKVREEGSEIWGAGEELEQRIDVESLVLSPQFSVLGTRHHYLIFHAPDNSNWNRSRSRQEALLET